MSPLPNLTSPSFKPSKDHKHQDPAMAEELQWVTFDDSEDDDEALSLCDLPVAAGGKKTAEEEQQWPAKDDFEFRILRCAGDMLPETDMCAAEDVFFHGQLRPSLSFECTGDGRNPNVSRSDCSGNLGFNGGWSVSRSQCVSRSDSGSGRSVSRSHSSNSNFSWSSDSSSSLCFESGQKAIKSSSSSYGGRSITGSSSCCVSRSHSSNSCSSAPPPRLCNAFYTHPSPSPQLRHGRRNRGGGGGRRSTGSAPTVGWGLFRLGVAMAPEIELNQIRFRQGDGRIGRKPAWTCGEKNGEAGKRVNGVSRFIGGGLGCKCSPEDAISAKVPISAKKKEESRRVGGKERRERTAEWLEELSNGEGRMY